MTTPRRAGLGARPEIEPDLDKLAATVALLYLEVESGRRPAQQIRGLVSPAVYERLLVRPRLRGRGQSGPSTAAIRAVHTSQPAPDAVEASVVVAETRRTRAIALRLERHIGRWRVVELCRPDDGEPPRRTASLTQGPAHPDPLDRSGDECGDLGGPGEVRLRGSA